MADLKCMICEQFFRSPAEFHMFWGKEEEPEELGHGICHRCQRRGSGQISDEEMCNLFVDVRDYRLIEFIKSMTH